ncbi:MAG: host attachment family protein [Hyphomicrobium sp.]|nr:host attachment family protein [Hyphomicrobium sp.]
MHLKHGMWVVVADGARALVLENRGSALEPRLALVREYDQRVPRSHELGRDRPGRAFESVGTRRSGVEAPDLHERQEAQFLEGLAQDLAADAASEAFEQLAVVAPPVALGVLRGAFDKPLSSRVAAWIDKDLTKHRIEDIAAAVETALQH